jgi:hypothetical protein
MAQNNELSMTSGAWKTEQKKIIEEKATWCRGDE